MGGRSGPLGESFLAIGRNPPDPDLTSSKGVVGLSGMLGSLPEAWSE